MRTDSRKTVLSHKIQGRLQWCDFRDSTGVKKTDMNGIDNVNRLQNHSTM